MDYQAPAGGSGGRGCYNCTYHFHFRSISARISPLLTGVPILVTSSSSVPIRHPVPPPLLVM
ncbi:hypothetical protein DM02DRAFT_8244 [Periconia macrospinosa]|uniref:Uncharacterized protein n=1 Tax=Periconia macrospinosa TaxID=97972 RepID=A0A2V1EH07_9PLEO|nr:hypothetical protein DM02DRAFT_8244 [Periconia macrospinosa]